MKGGGASEALASGGSDATELCTIYREKAVVALGLERKELFFFYSIK